MAKNSLERYTHYYERWASNQSVYISFKFFIFISVSYVVQWIIAFVKLFV